MKNIVLVGTQWGDEGKGRFVDFLAEDADVVVRFQGGDNAGHTVVIGDDEHKLHLLPSGMLSPGKINIIGNGVVINPLSLVREMEEFEAKGFAMSGLRISDRAHVVLPYHLMEDAYAEKSRGEGSIGTTLKGIGPAYTDKAERSGLRVCDLMDTQRFVAQYAQALARKNEVFTKVYGEPAMDIEPGLGQVLAAVEKMRPYVCDTIALLHECMEGGKNVLFEGAQATLLDIDLGTYPYVTSSHPTAGGVCAGAGVGPTAIDGALGVVKAYTTRVGEGPFVTELDNDLGEAIRQKGHEYGATTGRSRRCGWLDAVILKYAARVNGLSHLAVTRMDTFGGFDRVKICTGYEVDGQLLPSFPADLTMLERCTPVYEEMDGWRDDISDIKRFEDLPQAAQDYICRIEELVGLPVAMIGLGARRDQAIRRANLFDK